MDMQALCLLGETKGHVPDPRAAKNVLKVLSKMLGLELDLSGLDAKIREAERIREELEKLELVRMLAGEREEARRKPGRPEYIF